MDSNDVNSAFIAMIEENLTDLDDKSRISMSAIELMGAVAKMNELSTYLSRYVLGHLISPEGQKPLPDSIYPWLADMNETIAVIVQELVGENCECPDCACVCEEMPEDELCPSCIRYENCECDVDFTCETCLEYEENHPPE